MKRTVTVIVKATIKADGEAGIQRAIRELRSDPPFKSETVMGITMPSYSVQTHARARVTGDAGRNLRGE